MVTNPGLRIFLSLKTTTNSIFEPLFDKRRGWFRIGSLNKVCCTHLDLQLCLKDDGLVWIGLKDIRLQSGVLKIEPEIQITSRKQLAFSVFEIIFECPNVLQKSWDLLYCFHSKVYFNSYYGNQLSCHTNLEDKNS